jgi:ParB-like chromosome segregation protein Spo0J
MAGLTVTADEPGMDLEFHQLDLRYEHLRVRQPARERRLLASLADIGQQMPIVVVASRSGAQVVVDGYKRVHCLQRLHRDTVQAVAWEMAEPDALIFRQRLHAEAADSAIEEGWLLRTLHEDHRVPMEQLARRFDRSVSWVSRRLSLVRDLPDVIQRRVQEGRIVAHAAMKYLVPLARANRPACLRLTEAVASRPLSTRQIGRLYQAYVTGTAAVRELVLTDPGLVLRLDEETQRPAADLPTTPAAAAAFLSDLHVLGAVARRATRRLRDGLTLLPPDREQAWRACCQAQTDVDHLSQRCRKELDDARSGDPHGDSGAADTRAWRAPDCARAADLPRRGAEDTGDREPAGAAP